MREAAASGEWTSRYDYAVALLQQAGIDVLGSDASRLLDVPKTMLQSPRALEAQRHLISLANEDYAPALVLLWRLGVAHPGAGDLQDTLGRAAELGHPTAGFARLRSKVGEANLCAHRDRLVPLAENGQIEAVVALASCAAKARSDQAEAAIEAMSWLHRAAGIRAERSYYGWSSDERNGVFALESMISERLSDANRAEAEARATAWLEEVYDPIPPQCQKICFMKERGFYSGNE
jgi:hypothetical protein